MTHGVAGLRAATGEVLRWHVDILWWQLGSEYDQMNHGDSLAGLNPSIYYCTLLPVTTAKKGLASRLWRKKN